MKTTSMPVLLLAVFTSLAACSMHARGGQTNAEPERIGIYDSRVVAYAHFWSDAHQKKINAQVTAAKAAKAAGDMQKVEELGKAISDEQRRSHRTVFSTAPVDDVLAEIKDRLPGIKRQAGVSNLVSKWDETVLKQYSKAERVDITDLLAQEFKPGEKQLKVIADIKRQKPVPLDEINKIKDH